MRRSPLLAFVGITIHDDDDAQGTARRFRSRSPSTVAIQNDPSAMTKATGAACARPSRRAVASTQYRLSSSSEAIPAASSAWDSAALPESRLAAA